MRARLIWVCAVMTVLALPAVSRADFLVSAYDYSAGSGTVLVYDDANTLKTTIWTGGTGVTATYDPDTNKVFANFGGYGIYTYNLDGTGQTKVLDNTDGGYLRIQGGKMYVNPWPAGMLEAFNMSDLNGSNLGATPVLQWTQFTPAPPNPGWKSKQMLVYPGSGTDLLLAEFYGARVIRWDGATVNGGYSTLRTTGADYCTGVATDGTTLFYSRDDHDGAAGTHSYVYSAALDGTGTPAVFHDYNGTGFQPESLLVKGGVLYAGVWGGWSHVGSNIIDRFSIADGSSLGQIILPVNYELIDIQDIIPKSWLAGDADKDGKVDFTDYQHLEANFGATPGATWAMGDFDGNGAVEFTDYQMLESNFGTGVVPEPVTMLLLACGVVGLIRRR